MLLLRPIRQPTMSIDKFLVESSPTISTMPSIIHSQLMEHCLFRVKMELYENITVHSVGRLVALRIYSFDTQMVVVNDQPPPTPPPVSLR
jgi:hypothetical protein